MTVKMSVRVTLALVLFNYIDPYAGIGRQGKLKIY